MNTLLYKIIKVNTVTRDRSYTGSMTTVRGKRFSKKTDREALDNSPTCQMNNKGDVVRYEVERFDESALKMLAETLKEAALLVAEIESNMNA